MDNNPDDCADMDYDEAVEEEERNIVGLWAIDTDSKLYDLLLEWYGNDEGKMMASVRDAFHWDGYNIRAGESPT